MKLNGKKTLAVAFALALGVAGMYAVVNCAHASQGHEEHASEPESAKAPEEHGHAEGEAGHAEDGDEHRHEEAKGEHGHDEAKDEHGHGEEEKLEIGEKAAEAMNITFAEAGAAKIRVAIPVTGKIALNKNTIAQVRARFAGVVKTVTKTQGEMVTAGETLATVESNESLQAYPVKSPIGGIVLDRNTNVGHVTGEENLFEIADLSSLWVQFHVFPKDMPHVTEGQSVRVVAVGSKLDVETAVSSILPVADSASQTVVARGLIDNKDGKWRPGMSVHGEIFVDEKQAPVTVKVSALQRVEGKTVVFVQEGESYEARAVRLGLQDSEHAEVLEGLKAGEKYVADNSFILKAHAGKSEAEHEH